MIVGIGSDLCNIDRIQNSIDRFGDRFLNRVFTETERAKAARRRSRRWRIGPLRHRPAAGATSPSRCAEQGGFGVRIAHRAASISSRILRTASSSPTNTASPTR